MLQSNFQKFKTNEPVNLIYDVRYIKKGVRYEPHYCFVFAANFHKPTT